MPSIKARYGILITGIATFFLVELIVGIIANSITLQTDAFHMLSDLLALIIGLTALLTKHYVHHRYTYGWIRTEIIAGLVNSVFLLSIGFMLFIENMVKFVELNKVTRNDQLSENIDLVLIVAGIGLIINLIGVGLFWGHSHSHSHGHGHSHDDTVKNYAQAAVLLHIIGDAMGSVIVIISGLVIKFSDGDWRFYLDPIGSLLVIAFITISSSGLLWECIKILMLRWDGTALETIVAEITRIPGIKAVHEFHVWPLDNKISSASIHVQMDDDADIESSTARVKTILHSHAIHSSTIQPEYGDFCNEPVCELDCLNRQCCKSTF